MKHNHTQFFLSSLFSFWKSYHFYFILYISLFVVQWTLLNLIPLYFTFFHLVYRFLLFSKSFSFKRLEKHVGLSLLLINFESERGLNGKFLRMVFNWASNAIMCICVWLLLIASQQTQRCCSNSTSGDNTLWDLLEYRCLRITRRIFVVN